MKNLSNTIFIDFAATLFPNRVSLLPHSNKKKLSQFSFSEHIHNTQADIVAVNLLNELHSHANFNLVLIDNWINTEIHKKEDFVELLCMNGVMPLLHDNWTIANNDYMKSPLGPISEWMKGCYTENYTAILDEKYKHQLDFNVESKVAFDHAVFIDPENGISFKNIREINKSIKLWI